MVNNYISFKGDITGSMTTYNKASKYSDASAGSMTGVIRAQLLLDNLEEAASSLEFLTELNSSIGLSAVSYFAYPHTISFNISNHLAKCLILLIK